MSVEESEEEKAAEVYVTTHVKYADEPGRFKRHLEDYRSYPEGYPEAETCDGCDRDSIAVYQAYLAGIEWERKRLLGVVENIQNANKPFTMAGIIERESILHTFRQELGAFDEKKAQPTEGGE